MWKATTLGEVAEIITGPFGSALHKSDYKPSGTAVLMPQNIGNRTVDYQDIARIGEEDTERLSRYRVTQDDIIYARRGDVEKHAFVTANDTDMICGTGCMRIRVSSPEVMPKFASFYLNRPETRQWVVQHAVGSNMPNLNSGIVSAIPLSYPPKDEQEAIVDLLDSLDVAIATNVQVNDNLQVMLQTLYGYWFLQFDFPDENGRPYRSSGGRMAWNDQLKREIPLDWRVGANEELFDGIRTGLNPRQNFNLRTQGIAYLTVKNLTKDGGLDFTSCDYIDEEAMAKVRRRSDLRVGDILFASIAPLRRCFLIYEEPRDWEINESVFSIRPRRGVTTPEYVYCHLMSDAFVKQAEQSSTGSIFKGIRHETLKGMMTVIPPETIAQSYASAVSPIMRMRNDNLEENRKLQELRDWLLPLLMNGQATVASSDKLSFT